MCSALSEEHPKQKCTSLTFVNSFLNIPFAASWRKINNMRAMQVAARMSMDCMEAVNMGYMVRVRSMVMDVDMDLGLGMGRHMDLDMVVVALDKYPRGGH